MDRSRSDQIEFVLRLLVEVVVGVVEGEGEGIFVEMVDGGRRTRVEWELRGVREREVSAAY